MRKVLILGMFVALTGIANVSAQTAIPIEAVTTTMPLQKADRARYLCRQLELTPEQQKVAEGLIEVTWEIGGEQPLDIEEVRRIWKELSDAMEAGDKERQTELEGQLRRLGQGMDHEPEFIANLSKELTEDQKKRLAAAQERLTRNPSGAIRPVDLFDTAEMLGLSDEQKTKMNTVRENFRKEISAAQNMDDSGRVQALNLLYEYIKPELTPEQTQRYTLLIQGLRPERADRGVAPGRKVRRDQAEATPAESD